MDIPRIKYERSYRFDIDCMYKNASESRLLQIIREGNPKWELVYRYHICQKQMSDIFLIEVRNEVDWSLVLKHQKISNKVWGACESYIRALDEYEKIKKMIICVIGICN